MQTDKLNEIRTMIQRWYDGHTDIVEEQALIEWFATTPDNEIPDDLRADAAIFRSLAVETTLNVEEEKNFTSALEAVTTGPVHKRGTPPILVWIGRTIAAAAAITLLFVLNNSDKRPVSITSVTSPHVASLRQDSIEGRHDSPDSSAPEPKHIRTVSRYPVTSNTIAESEPDADSDEVTDVTQTLAVLQYISTQMGKVFEATDNTLIAIDNNMSTGFNAIETVNNIIPNDKFKTL